MKTLSTPFVATIIVLITCATSASQIVVNSLDDDGGAGDCELREAIINANNDNQSGSSDCAAGSGADTIDLTGVSGTILLNGTELLVTSDMLIDGPGADQLTIDGNDLSRVFTVGGATHVTIQDLTITRGAALGLSAPGNHGGGILNLGALAVSRCIITGNHAANGSGILNANTGSPYSASNGTLNILETEISENSPPPAVDGNGGGVHNSVALTVVNSTISDNESDVGGGIYNGHTATIVNTTLSGNLSGSGGAIYTWPGSPPNSGLTLWHSTITDNHATGPGGGLYISVTSAPDTAKVHLYSTIIARNFRGTWAQGPDIKGPVTNSQGYNLLGNNANSSGLINGVNGDQVGTNSSPIDPMLFVLSDNGGHTKTHIPLEGSPVIDNGSCVLSSAYLDQRSFSRPLDLPDATYPNADDGCDVGSIEPDEEDLWKGIKLVAGVFLEGPYVGTGSMSLAINPSLPNGQPYDDVQYDETVIDYDGPESVSSVPSDIVDWVLVSLRTGTDPATEIVERAALLQQGGVVVGLDGDTLRLPVTWGSYHVVLRHRNHLSVMSADPVSIPGLGTWDFRYNLSNAYTAGGAAMKNLGDGSYAMFASDGNADGQVTAPDFNLWNAATTAGAIGYEPSDYNMDGQVTAPDFNLWNANTTAGAASRVPD